MVDNYYWFNRRIADEAFYEFDKWDSSRYVPRPNNILERDLVFIVLLSANFSKFLFEKKHFSRL